MKLIVIPACLSLALICGCSFYGKSATARSESAAVNKTQTAATPQTETEAPRSSGSEVTTDVEVKDELHTPAKGTPEREAIMDVLRAEVKKETGEDVVFVVNILKVHNGWAWVDVTPNRKDGTALYEGKEALLHQEKGAWKDMALPPQDSDDDQRMFGDLSGKYIRKIQQKYPSCPADIFPKPSD